MPAVDIDAMLQRLRASLGAGPPPGWPPRSFGGAVPPATEWTGVASAAARSASDSLDARRQILSNAHASVGPIVQNGGQVSLNARSRLDAIYNQWLADKAALDPVATTPAGKIALLRAGALRIGEAQAVVKGAQAQFASLAGQVETITASLSTARSNKPATGGVQAVDYTEVPEAPRIPPPESPWEYNLDFTSDVEAGSSKYPGVTSAGEVTSIDDVWNELNRCFNCNFPMGGAPKNLPKVGDELPLEIRMAGQKLPANFPVRVTQVARSANDINIEFVTLPGHVDGPGSTIHFRFYEGGGQLHLGIRGYITQGPGSEDIPILSPGLRTGYTGVAMGVWQPYIDRVTRHVAEAKGLMTYGGR
ncbi:DUF4226 domain-containing protein [Mycobacterium riyadhense]|uniref:DUF4226 domain-containing protein n=2 Tax=Mycobacterium riyadhense TaxID=486698 RepID=UPI00111C0BAB|nr:DUF4226 domain-containing protein [Mycobacterium riyadhense]MCV7145581.1 DUF4226 domain-containing protein [Mycobacterium riyadhense]